jgi:hypothetical protein
MWFPSVNQVAFSANGAQNLTITPSGIGVAGTVGVAINVAGNNTTTSLNWGTNGTGLYGDATTISSAISGTEVTRLTSTGLGIGTSSPSSKFVVSDSGAVGFEVNPIGVASSPALVSYNRSGAAYTQLTALALRHVWQLSGTEAMRLDSSGNLGLGVTPSAWNTSYKGSQVGSTTALWGISSGAGGSFLSNNVVFDTTSARKYLVTGTATEYGQASGAHTWSTAASGTAGNAITFTQAMTLDASGNLGVGTTSPQRRFVVSLAGAQGLEFGAGTGASSGNELLNYNRSTSAYIPFTALSSTYTFYVGTSGSTRAVDIDSSGNLLVGGTAARGTTVGTKHLDLFDGTAPAGTLTNGVSLYSSSGDLKFMNAAGDAFDVGYRNIPQNAQTGNYTLTLADSGDHIYHAVGAGAATYTIPANGSVAFPIGTAVTFINMSTTSISIAITTDTMYLSSAGTTGTRTLAQYGSATAIKVTSTTWLISGSGLT